MTIFRSGAKLIARALAVASVTLLGACASFYVDNTVHEVTPAERVAVAHRMPVQFLFDFQTKGASNTRARDLTKDRVTKAVQDSGLFSTVASEPQPNGALLQVTINNVPLSDDAFAKGFAVGLTFGLAGATVGDGYVCTIDYIGGPNEPKITKMSRDAIYTSIGATASKPNAAVKVSNIDEAVNIMVRTVVSNGLNELAGDPAFGK